MGARGPAPTPTAILKVRGSWRGKARKNEPTPPPEAPDCPAWLDEEAKAEWNRQVILLEAVGILTQADRFMLAAYCEACSEVLMLKKLIDNPKLSYADAIRAGYVNAKNKAVDRAHKIAAKFGFTPADRTRIQTEPQEKPQGGKSRFFKVS